MKSLDLGYNLVKTHDGASAFLIVDHDEEDMISIRAPVGNVYSPGARLMLALALFTLWKGFMSRAKYLLCISRLPIISKPWLSWHVCHMLACYCPSNL